MKNFSKDEIKQQIINCLSGEPEVKKIIVFGSFVTSDKPGDIDIAIFQDSSQDYYTIGKKYRKLLRPLILKYSMDIIPIDMKKTEESDSLFLKEILKGEVLYEEQKPLV